MDKFRKEQIVALEKAVESCRQGGCEVAIPYIVLRINWLKDNCNFYD